MSIITRQTSKIKWANALNRYFAKKDIQRPINTWKGIPYQSSRKCKLTTMRYTAARIAQINVGGGKELSFIAGFSVKWCSQFGKLVIS